MRKNSGITLIALVVTIIILVILAAVSITTVLGDNGLIQKAQQAAEETKKAAEDEAKAQKELLTELEKIMNGGGSTEEEPPKEVIVDGVKIPEEFTQLEGNTKEEGIVIKDKVGNQYVWVPVTKNEDGTPTKPYEVTNGKLREGSDIEIQLGRYSFDSSGIPSLYTNTDYTEDSPENHNSEYRNEIAINIEDFKNSVKENGGYFIARYEAGIEGGTLASESNSENSINWTGYTGGKVVIKSGQQVWNYITQNKASELCKNISAENGYTNVISDLVNSYAWDTAILYIQKCGKETNSSNYSKQLGKSTTPDTSSKTGEAKLESTQIEDKQCNIYDMSGNYYEWITETYHHFDNPCTSRGGRCGSNNYCAGDRLGINVSNALFYRTFRPLLYW